MPNKLKIGVEEYIDAAHSATIKGQPYPLHGHTYKVEAWVEGPVVDGIVFDFCDLRDILKKVLEKYNKKNLNDLLENSTGENFALSLHRDLKEKIPNLKIGVKLWQGHNKWAECSD